MIYLELFYTFFMIGLFTFGGGYAMISLIHDEVVTNHHWIDSATFTDIIAISQTTPGPIGINSATYIGYSVTGNVFGSAVATFAACLPSFIIILLICKMYVKFKENQWFEAALSGIRPVVIGLIGSAAILLITPQNFPDWRSWAIFGASFIACQWFKMNPIYLLIISGIVGVLIY
ncbi:MAG: chromate transporter [Bacteroidales bacterium]|jgi:chromate transporter